MEKGKEGEDDERPSCMETQGPASRSGHAGLFPEVTPRAVIGWKEFGHA